MLNKKHLIIVEGSRDEINVFSKIFSKYGYKIATSSIDFRKMDEISFETLTKNNVDYLKVPVNITINEPTTLIEKNENYFVGNNAVAYGTANTTTSTVSYDLASLFKTTTGMSYVETEYKKADGVTPYTKWLTSGSTVNVPIYSNATNADHFETVYATREYTARCRAFNNAHIEDAVYKFNLTVKSPIFEGTFTSDFTAEITNSDDLNIPVSEFVGTDVYGDNYYVGNVNIYDSKGNYTSTIKASTDIQTSTVKISAADDNAKNYLQIVNRGKLKGITVDNKDQYGFVIKRASIPSGLQVDTPCKLTVSFTDNWGRIKSTTITVVLKKTVK